jgi:hypothetical protein
MKYTLYERNYFRDYKNMHQLIDNVLVIKNNRLTCFFEPESLFVFVKEDSKMKDEKIISDFNENKKNRKLETFFKKYS